MNLCGSLPNHENRNVYDGTSPQGLSEARRAGFFFELFVTDPPRGRPFGGGGDHRTWRSVKKISYHTRIVQFSWENAQFQAKRSRVLHPPPLWLPDAITPEQVLHHHRSAQGRHGGTGTVPSFIRTSILNFISMEKEFYRAEIP